ncbi:hypothetical protein EV700_3022 [Fluviicoccus keumensis]|uniref:Uncharacterized protein n=1 Tax=Fluviicoccus keumensis TaxID=1435465 RepID=A0A4Q7YK16_9GAMM|nr:hypothetical protein [Fluviicoccus keumensis]RZU37153.1 hypothetical protein EV700_3022 [Fluviicoccus keumensis]
MNIFRFYVWNPETGILPKSEPEARNYVQAREAARDWPPMDDKLRGFIRDVEQKAPLEEDLFDIVTLGELETLSKTTENNQRGGCVIVDFPMGATVPEMDFVVRLGVNAGLVGMALT